MAERLRLVARLLEAAFTAPVLPANEQRQVRRQTDVFSPCA